MTTTQTLENKVFNNDKLIIYPNPSNSVININVKENVKIESVIISDITGKTFLSQFNDNKTIGIENFSNGLYFIEINCDGIKLTYKFQKK